MGYMLWRTPFGYAVGDMLWTTSKVYVVGNTSVPHNIYKLFSTTYKVFSTTCSPQGICISCGVHGVRCGAHVVEYTGYIVDIYCGAHSICCGLREIYCGYILWMTCLCVVEYPTYVVDTRSVVVSELVTTTTFKQHLTEFCSYTLPLLPLESDTAYRLHLIEHLLSIQTIACPCCETSQRSHSISGDHDVH